MMLPMNDDEEQFFTAPLPPPPPVPPGAGIRHERDVLFFRHGEPPQRDREHEDIMLRKVPTDVARRFRAAAGGRALTHAQYLAALVELHESIRTRADGGDDALRQELDRLGLQSVTV
jgi:hypothetical protein